MKNLIPEFILEQYEQKKYSGEFKAYTMFIDISGFTKMTETLMTHGKVGAEILSDILEFLFTPSISIIYEHKGFISTFEGDAFTAIFTHEDVKPEEILASAKEIQKFFKGNKIYKSKYGNFEFSIKIGLSYGNIDWGIITNEQLGIKHHENEDENNRYATYYFRGEAIDNCSKSEHFADAGEIWMDDNFFSCAKDFVIERKTTGNHHKLVKLKELTNIVKIPVEKRDYSKELIELFAGKNESNFPKGEFRDIVSVFISFENVSDLSGFMKTIFDNQKIFGGSHPHLDFGDKGGNVLIFFGAPISYENYTMRALDFILKIRDEIDAKIKIRAGLAKGVLYCGFNGSELREEFACLGNTTNLSARLMMKADFGKIYIDKSMFDKENKAHNISFVDEILFKGIKNKIPVYKLNYKETDHKQSFYEGKMIGREKDLKNLEDIVKPIFKKRFGGIVYVDGIAGIGKSRLVYELKNRLTVGTLYPEQNGHPQGEQINWFSMPCDEVLIKSFNPVIYFFKEYFNQSEENNIEDNKVNFEEKYNSLVTIFSNSKNRSVVNLKKEILSELKRTISIIGALLNLHWDNSLYEKLDAKGRYENTLDAIKNFIKAKALLIPTIIVLEDGHRIDNDTRKLLEFLTRNVENIPFVIISDCRYNDDGSVFKFGLKEVTENRIDLEYLSREGSNFLIENKVKTVVPTGTLNLIFEKSEGNPFFIEQIILYFLENNLFDKDFNIKSEIFKIPSNINSIIIARIDRLRMELKEVIKVASVLGRKFSIKILSKILLNHPIEEHLLEGEKQVIWESLTELNYIFKHALIREAVYEMQLKIKLKELHKLAANVIEEYFKDEIKSYYPDLANHYEKAEITDKAIEYLEKAGDYAKENYQNKNAIDFYKKLLKITNMDNSKSTIDIYLKKGETLQLIGKWDEALADFETSLEIAEELKNKKYIAKAEGSIGRLLHLKGDYTKAMLCYQKELKISEDLVDKREISRTLGDIGVLYSNKGDYDIAMNYYEKQLKICEVLGTKDGISKAVGNMGSVYYHKGDYSKAMECYEKELKTCKELDDKKGISGAIGNMGNIYYHKGDLVKAMECYEKDLKICEELGDKSGISRAGGNIGIIYHRKNDTARAMEYYEKALKIFEELGNKSKMSTVIGNIGGLYQERGDYTRAMEYYKRYLKISEELENKDGVAAAVGAIAHIYNITGDYTRAMEYYENALKIYKELDDSNGISSIFGGIALAYSEKKDLTKAINYYERAITINRNLKMKALLAYHLFYKAEVLYKMKDYEEAKESNKECFETAKEIEDLGYIFKSKILSAKIDFRTTINYKLQIINCLKPLEKIVQSSNDENQIALLNYELAIMNSEMGRKEIAKEHKTEAMKLYKKLYEKMPKIEYKNKIEELENL